MKRTFLYLSILEDGYEGMRYVCQTRFEIFSADSWQCCKNKFTLTKFAPKLARQHRVVIGRVVVLGGGGSHGILCILIVLMELCKACRLTRRCAASEVFPSRTSSSCLFLTPHYTRICVWSHLLLMCDDYEPFTLATDSSSYTWTYWRPGFREAISSITEEILGNTRMEIEFRLATLQDTDGSSVSMY